MIRVTAPHGVQPVRIARSVATLILVFSGGVQSVMAQSTLSPSQASSNAQLLGKYSQTTVDKVAEIQKRVSGVMANPT